MKYIQVIAAQLLSIQNNLSKVKPVIYEALKKWNCTKRMVNRL